MAVNLLARCDGDSYILSLENSNDLTYDSVVWHGPENYTFSGAEADISGLKEGEYTVTVNTNDGCTMLASIMVENTYCGDISKGLSPDGDGFNDYFDLSNLNVLELKIFNRYGLLIYESGNYKKEWHGQTDNGNEVPTGTYYYVASLASGKKVTGWVYVQRKF